MYAQMTLVAGSSAKYWSRSGLSSRMALPKLTVMLTPTPLACRPWVMADAWAPLCDMTLTPPM